MLVGLARDGTEAQKEKATRAILVSNIQANQDAVHECQCGGPKDQGAGPGQAKVEGR